MAAMELTALIAMVCIIVSNLTMVLLKEYKLLKGVKHEIADLKGETSHMNALLADLDGMEELDVQQKEWKVKLRELSFAIEECIDLFKYHLAEGDGKTGFIGQFKALRVRHNIAKKIQKLKARVADQRHGHERYRLDNECITNPNQPPLVAIDPRLSALHEGTGLVGIDRSKRKIIRWLLTEEGSGASSQIRALSIVGCGGIGKSTLAKEVYQAIRGQFDCSVFVPSASRRQSIKWVFEEMLSGLGFQGNTTGDTEYQLIDKLREYLKEKRYLVVIGDIWSEEAWNNISHAFLENNRRSRVVMTTRHQNALQSSSFHGHVYNMKPLNDADSRRLFFGRVFDFSCDCPEHLRDTLEQIVKKCGGVPLLILSLAGTLANQNVMVTENWEKILSSLVYGVDRNPGLEMMRYLLDLSYRDLCPNLRNCMLYLGMHPENPIISKDHLVRRWIAEGFVSKAYGCTQEELAESYFNQLINRSIIQVADFNGHGQAISCQVHDVVLGFILSKAMEENFFAIVEGAQQIFGKSTEIRRVCFHVEHTECYQVMSSMDLSHARSLDFWACSKCQPSLSRFHLLRVLHIHISHSSTNGFIGSDLTILCKLYLLRYLKITTSSPGSTPSRFVRRTCKLPTQIRTLRYLKTLDIDVDLLLLGFPDDICEVTSLSNIIVSSSPPPNLPNGIARLRALRILRGFSVLLCSVKNIQGLGELSDLMELEVHVDAPEDAQVAAANSMHRLNKLQSLVIHCGDTMSSRSNFAHHLRYWFPPRGLQRLHVHGCFFHSFPDWMAQLHMLSSLVLGVARLSSVELDVLARLPSLVELTLSIGEFVQPQPQPQGVFWLLATGQPEAKILIRGGMFPRLKSLWFRYDVPCDLMFEPGAMPNLESLGMRFVVERTNPAAPVLAGIEHLQSLTSYTAHIHSSRYGNQAFIDLYYRAVSNTWSLWESLWWNCYVRSAENTLQNAISCHRACHWARPLVHHIQYGEKPKPGY